MDYYYATFFCVLLCPVVRSGMYVVVCVCTHVRTYLHSCMLVLATAALSIASTVLRAGHLNQPFADFRGLGDQTLAAIAVFPQPLSLLVASS